MNYSQKASWLTTVLLKGLPLSWVVFQFLCSFMKISPAHLKLDSLKGGGGGGVVIYFLSFYSKLSTHPAGFLRNGRGESGGGGGGGRVGHMLLTLIFFTTTYLTLLPLLG